MSDPSSALNWSALKDFLAVAQYGSLSEAARRLGVSQPTLTRRMAALESSLKAELFQRSPRGLVGPQRRGKIDGGRLGQQSMTIGLVQVIPEAEDMALAVVVVATALILELRLGAEHGERLFRTLPGSQRPGLRQQRVGERPVERRGPAGVASGLPPPGRRATPGP